MKILDKLEFVKTNDHLSIVYLYDYLDRNRGSKDKVDKLLKKIEFENVALVVVISLLRNTYNIRGLKNYKPCLKRAISFFKSKKINYKKLLNGLLD